MHRSTKVAFAAALCSLAVPQIAAAASKTVVAGPPVAKRPAGVPKDGDIAQFYPASVKVRQGDTLTFRIMGFHTINFPKKGEGAPPLAIPGGSAVADVKDAAGAPFWFNGQPSLIFNPAVAFGTPSGGAYDGSAAVASGAPLSEGPPKPWKVELTKAGTYTFFCPIHPGMDGKVTVVGKGAKVPPPKADAARAKAQLAKGIAKLGRLDKAAPPKGDTIVAGPDAATGETLFRFTPATKKVKVGAPVTLTMASGTPEIHTFTFAKSLKALKPIAQAFIAPVPGTGTAGPPTLGFSAQVLYPSDAPLPAYDGTQHGDGFVSTGVLDGDPKSPQPQKATMTFAKPGTYEYLCLIHPDMKGKVVVTP